jgi:hypothetical protein
VGSILVRSNGGGSVLRERRYDKAAEGRGNVVGFVTTFALQKRRKRKWKGMGTTVPRTAGGEVAAGERSGALWCARRRTPGKGYSGGRSRGNAWGESGQELNGSEGWAVARGEVLRWRQSR